MPISSPAYDLRIALKEAARRVLTRGATAEQIESIIALSRGSGEYDTGDWGLLTRARAELVINFMVENGAFPDYRKSDEELAAEREAAAHAVEVAAAQKIAKSQDKEAKAARDEARTASDRKIEGRRVTHAKFGEGTVIAEDERSLTVMFDSQKKALRLTHESCKEAA